MEDNNNEEIEIKKNLKQKEFGTQTDNLYIEFKSFSVIQYFQILFNIDSKDFFKRLIYSLIFFMPKLAIEINNNPDFYSTLWIFMCMIFTFTFNSNLKSYFKLSNLQNNNNSNNSGSESVASNSNAPSTTSSVESTVNSTSSVSVRILEFIFKEESSANTKNNNEVFKPNLALIGKSFLFLLFIGFIVPLLLSIIFNAMDIFNRKRNLISIYGYSYFIVLIGSIISLINVSFVAWIVYLYCIVTNILGLLIWIRKEVLFNKSNMNFIGYLLIILLQLGIFFMIWFMYLKV